MSITSNAGALANKWKQAADKLGPTMRKATEENTKIYFAEAKKQMGELIYDKPVPTKADIAAETGAKVKHKGEDVPATWVTIKGRRVPVPLKKNQAGKPAWKRTGNLKRSEKMKIVSNYLGIVENTANYASARHAMGTPAAKKYPKSRYPAPWREMALAKTRTRMRNNYRKAMLMAIRSGLVSGPGGH